METETTAPALWLKGGKSWHFVPEGRERSICSNYSRSRAQETADEPRPSAPVCRPCGRGSR